MAAPNQNQAQNRPNPTNTPTPPKNVVKSEHPQDQVNQTQTLYDAPLLKVFWRNLVAGMARGLGGIMIYLVFIVIIAQIFTNVIYPQIEPFIQEYRQALGSLNTITGNNQNSDQTSSNSHQQIEDILNAPAFQQLFQEIER